MSTYLLPDGAVAIDGVIHIVLRGALDTMCGLPAVERQSPDAPNLTSCDTCMKAHVELRDRDVRHDLRRRR